MKRFRITKIVYAKDFAAALAREGKHLPVEISLDEPVDGPRKKMVRNEVGPDLIGFKYIDNENEADTDGGE